MSTCRYRTYRITRNGILKLNGYSTNETPKRNRSWIYEPCRELYSELGVEALFVKEILASLYAGGDFSNDKLVVKHNLLGVFLEDLDSLGVDFNGFVESWNDSKVRGVDKYKVVKHLAEKNNDLIQKFIRK